MVKKILVNLIILIMLINSFIFLFPINYVQAANHNQVTIKANSKNNNGINAFPESYKKALKKLVEETGHTNWKFEPFYTDIDWAELTNSSNENRCLRNTIYKSNGSWICSCGRRGDAGYYCASSRIVNYYLDPRNFLTETTIFQFLDLSNSTKVSIKDIEKAVKGTYLEGSANGKKYAQMIYEASEASGEGALSIVVKIFQELGKGKELPGMISGKNKDYPNTYNFFNYGASDGDGNIQRGLEYAKNAGWNTPEKALIEGTKLIANSYTNVGQNTKYTFKFDVVDDKQTGLYWHQYMTNIQDPTNQAKMLYDEYLNNDWLNQSLTFIIPVYKNMPTYVKLPSNLTTEDGKLYFISSNYGEVILRAEPNTSSEVLTQLKKDTVVLMKTYNEKKSGWSKVSVNGQEGYVSNKYLTQVNLSKDKYSVPTQESTENSNTNTETNTSNTTNNTNTVATNTAVTNNNTTSNTNKVNTTINTAKNNTTNTATNTSNGKTTVTIKNTQTSQIKENNITVLPNLELIELKKQYPISDAKGSKKAKLATGTQVTINEKVYTIVKLGDINKDGEINSADLLKIVKYLKGSIKIEGEALLSADCNNDGKVNSADLLKIIKYLKGTANIAF